MRRTDGSVQRVDLPPQATVITFAGDLVAYAIPAPQRRHGAFDDHPPQRVVVRRWRTGTRVASGRIPAGVANLDLSPAGALAVGESKGGVVELRPGRPPRRLARNGPSTSPGVPPVYAGERLVFVRSTRAFGVAQLMIASPRRGARPFGVPAPAIGSVTADPRRVLWTTGDCVLLAGVQAPAATAPAAGPCPRTEITFGRPLDSQRSTLRPGGLVPVVVDCVTAAAPGCRGTLRLTSGGAGTKPLGFTIPPGARRRLLVRLAPGFEAALRRGDCCPRELTIVAAAKDPDGRRSEYRGKLLLAMGD